MIGAFFLIGIPFAFILLTNWWMGGMQKFWKVMGLAFAFILLTYGFNYEVVEYLKESGVYPDVVTDYTSAFTHSLFAAALPEETAKLATVGLMLLVARYWKVTVEAKEMVTYSCLAGCAFALYEGLGNVLLLGQPIVSRCFAYFGHYYYSIVMGYGLYQYMKSRKDMKNVAYSLLWIIVLPIVMHMTENATIYCLRFTHNHLFLLAMFVEFVGFGYLTYKLIRCMRDKVCKAITNECCVQPC